MIAKVTNSFIIKSAKRVMSQLGGGHTESVYQCALVSLFMSQGVSTMTEVVIPYMVDGICVGTGRADILLKTHLIELKSSVPSFSGAENQLRKYMKAMYSQCSSPRSGVVILFDHPKHKVSLLFVSHTSAIKNKQSVKKLPVYSDKNNKTPKDTIKTPKRRVDRT